MYAQGLTSRTRHTEMYFNYSESMEQNCEIQELNTETYIQGIQKINLNYIKKDVKDPPRHTNL